ncbi:MAG TPA: carbohydrate-binding family 9-like protein [Prolixibacteraceae bacterium]
MKRIMVLLLTFSILFLSQLLFSQTIWKGYEHLFTPVQNYLVYQTKVPVLIDGKADEPDWGKAEWTADFADIEGANKPKPLFRTRMKMLWDESSLYLLAELEEPNIWAYYETHDQVVYHENDIEVFIDPDGDTHNYYEYELNARNTLFDLLMPQPYRNGGQAKISWNSEGFQSAVSIDGTLNDPSDQDKKWTVEMKIPFSDLHNGDQVQVPSDGQIWKIDFSRVEWRTEVIDGKYQKMKDPSTGRAYPEYNWVWSPTGLINMHYPERWGMIQFSKLKVGSKSVNFKMPAEEEIINYLWLVYYKQQNFRHQHQRYATNLEELEIGKNNEFKVNLTATAVQFTVHMEAKDGSVLTINETGLFRKSQKLKPMKK